MGKKLGIMGWKKALLKASDEIESSNKVISTFLTNKSHEIRTLMTRIIGMTDLMLMTELTEEQLDYLITLKSSTGLLLNVFNDMRDYSKIQTGKITMEQVPFDLRKTIHDVVNLFHVAAKQNNSHIRLNSIDNKIPKNLIGDSLRLKQVLSNLIGNGVKFTNNGEVTITVDFEKQDESCIYLKFIVTDTGTGIPEEKLKKLFNNFSHSEDSSLRKFKTTGLENSKKLVELMDGDLYVNSKEGLGSQFYFTAVFGVQE